MSAATTAPPPGARRADLLARSGIALGAVGGLVAALPAIVGERAVASQDGLVLTLKAGAFLGAGLVLAVLLAAAAAVPWPWARYVGIGVLAAALTTYALLVIGARASDDFLPDVDTGLETGGVLLVVAYVVTAVGLALAVIGAPRLGRGAPTDAAGNPRPAMCGYATASLVLSLCGLVAGVTAPLGIAFAVTALDDIRTARGWRTGRGLAVAGLVVGIVLTTFLVLAGAVGMAIAQPGSGND